MRLQTSKLPPKLDQALRELFDVREALRGQGYRKDAAIRKVNDRVQEIALEHEGSTAKQFMTVIQNRGFETASSKLREIL